MDFDSPDVEKDFPGLYASESGINKKRDESDFSESDHDKVSRKDLLIGRRKDKKDKKSNYATLEGESSPEDDIETKSPSKSKKSKTFKFTTSKSKDKREKSREKDSKIDKDVKDSKDEKETKEKEKKKEKKEKDKKEKCKDKEKDKKDKKSKQISICEEVLELGDVQPVFGVSVSLATERSRCHDGIDLPLVVRDCIDFLQDHGLSSDQIYKVDPIKTRLQHFKRLYNNRETSGIDDDLDIPTACGLLKLYLKELPEPILTTDLIARFEEVASHSDVTKQEKDLLMLLENLPSCNKMLLSWILLHFDCVTQNEKHNKMNAQSLAMLLSPPLQMSHRLLVTLLCHCTNLFATTKLIKYVPPITSSPKLPETPKDIQIELCKQESLLAQIHAEMNAGFVSKKREEQLWEVQRIITQLKRKLKSFEKKSEKSAEDIVDGDSMSTSTNQPMVDSYNNPKTKCSYSDDESTKTMTVLSTESVVNTETKSTSQETKSAIRQKQIKEPNDVLSSDDSDNSENLYVHETGILMLPESHPDFLTLIRLQLENQELINWKLQLQSRISAERSEIFRLNKLLTLAEQQQNQGIKLNNDNSIEDLTDIVRISEHYVQENSFLEHKRQMLAKEIFEESKEVLLLDVELALQSLKT